MNEADLKEAFEARRPALAAMGQWVMITVLAELEKQLGSKTALEKFLQIPPKPRVKETDSFLEKALVRKPKSDPLQEITDQVGVRFVVLLLEDIKRVCGIIEAGPWNTQKDRDFHQERLEKVDYFAYQSDHYVVTTNCATNFEGTNIPAGLSCEVQIRTILQHAYAEMAHSSSYKPPVKLPEIDQRQINRSLAKGSALIETTDDVFGEIKKRLRDYNESLIALLENSREIYKTHTGESPLPVSTLAEIIADTYRTELSTISLQELEQWASQNGGVWKSINQKRNESVFYRDSLVVFLGCLISKFVTTIPRRWPVDSSYLEDFYTTIGVSTRDLF